MGGDTVFVHPSFLYLPLITETVVMFLAESNSAKFVNIKFYTDIHSLK